MDLNEEISKRFRDDSSKHPVTGHRLIKGPYNKLVQTYGLDAPRKDSRYGRFREVYKTSRNQSNLPKCLYGKAYLEIQKIYHGS